MLTSLSLRGRAFFFRDYPLETFASIGVRYSLLDLRNAAEKPGYVIGNASYSGLGLEAGAGVLVDLFEGYRCRLDALFLYGATSSGTAFGSSLDQGPRLLGGSLELSIERYFF